MDYATVLQILDSAVRLMTPLLLACLAGGAGIAVQTGRAAGILSGFVAGSMHMAWSVGFWRQWLAPRRAPAMAAAR